MMKSTEMRDNNEGSPPQGLFEARRGNLFSGKTGSEGRRGSAPAGAAADIPLLENGTNAAGRDPGNAIIVPAFLLGSFFNRDHDLD